jgi:hypothetical protein
VLSPFALLSKEELAAYASAEFKFIVHKKRSGKMSVDDVSRTPPSPASTLSPPPSSSNTPPLPSPQPQQQRTLHQNSVDPNARWLLQKFGGTSVGKFPVKIARGIVSKYIDAYRVAVPLGHQ